MQVRLGMIALIAVSACFGDTLVLRSGKTVQGSFLGGTPRQIRMEVEGRIETYDVGDVQSLQFDAGAVSQSAVPPAAAPAPASAPAVAPATAAAPAPVSQPAPAAAPREERTALEPRPAAVPAKPAPSGTEVAAGSNITIRMIDDVDSQVASPGQTFRGSVDDAVVVNGQTLVPRGADAVLRLTELKEAGKIAGGGQLTLALDSITVNGRSYNVNTQTVTQEGESRKKDSAKVIGGTAALGAIIGAIAGGGKGAAIGAASGAGAGTAIQVLTHGPRVRIPSETRLTFTLQQAVRL